MDSFEKHPIVTEYPMEKQVRNLYTNSKFREFQVQLLKMMYCNFNKIEVNPDGKVYDVQQDIWIENNFYKKVTFYKKMTFFVTYNKEDCDVHCTCQMFVFRGIQCYHVLSLLSNNGVKELPDKYILRRWRKDVKRCYTKVKVGFSCWKNDDANTEYYDFCNKFGELADWVAGTSQYRDVDDWLDCKKKEVQQIFIKLKESDKLKEIQLEVSEAVDGNVEYGVGDNVVITVNDPSRKDTIRSNT
ncbi:protein FAR-RED IMPAIRED RESPONSE 1-like isoform X1 [Papaver somniferum]|uniref:protein FAR-RED IMPAIRED RESPONSE 1-like isoform X1 n=1 Tax=Papaver somniferum TaxID=3469 RepID=UPI000E6FD296|nr:protein FAR-RED IMPAIRED RESPONSE 1-like isoform X1 [Papaver somniferum]